MIRAPWFCARILKGGLEMIFAKLEKIEQRYSELERQLASPDVLSDQDKYSKLAKELSGISEIVGLWRDYRKTDNEISGLEQVLKEKHDQAFVELNDLSQRVQDSLVRSKD